MIRLADILVEAKNIDDIMFTISTHSDNIGPANLISFRPKGKTEQDKLNNRFRGDNDEITRLLADTYSKKSGVKMIPYLHFMRPTGAYYIQIDMEQFVKKFILK